MSKLLFSMDDLMIAYRKAKQEAYFDANTAHGAKFAAYERNLERNLTGLSARLRSRTADWHTDPDFLGAITYVPKSLDRGDKDESTTAVQFYDSDGLRQWRRSNPDGHRAKATFRPVIDATVDFMIVSALWVMKVGVHYDGVLSRKHVYGNRIRRRRGQDGSHDGVNERAYGLFDPYVIGYGNWRRNGLFEMRRELERGHDIVAITMDLHRFYHEVDARFLLEESYLSALDIRLSAGDRAFTQKLVKAINLWRSRSDEREPHSRGLPVGLSASSVIANCLLAEFDIAVAQELLPIYYGRYVDDVFLVIRPSKLFGNGDEVLEWIAARLRLYGTRRAGMVVTAKAGPDGGIEVELPYAKNSRLEFKGKKQRVFQLSGTAGLDLLKPIEESIRRLSSRHRRLPVLPPSESEMAADALVSSSDATLESDALRKADAVTLRRAGFRLLLNDVRSHVRDLHPDVWVERRREFYGLAQRHLITPRGLFEYANYIPDLFAIMTRCADWSEADATIDRVRDVLETLEETTAQGRTVQARSCWANLGSRVRERILGAQSDTAHEIRIAALVSRVCDVFGCTHAHNGKSTAWVTAESRALKDVDWGLIPYYRAWIRGDIAAETVESAETGVYPNVFAAGDIATYADEAKRPLPSLNHVVFSTRRPSIPEISSALRPSSDRFGDMYRFVNAIRGTWLRGASFPFVETDNDGHMTIRVTGERHALVRVSVVNLRTSEQQFVNAVLGVPDHSLERYSSLMRLLNGLITSDTARPHYVALPECSLPRDWAAPVATKLANAGISLIAGLEHKRTNRGSRNDALVSLVSDAGGFRVAVAFEQPKIHPAWHEEDEVRRLTGRGVLKVGSRQLEAARPVYEHGDVAFGVLICSDLASIKNRARFQGSVDALFIPEWNPDVNTFNALVESSAHDLHAFIVQANNREYGDSRIRAPFREEFRRDVVRIKGGVHDFFVTAEMNIRRLREAQTTVAPDSRSEFKPFPTGFKASRRRRRVPR
ncbi:reverse transcriptase domain-containing protein [Sandaracinus amylolyticus]|uniref:reverse transcriptase domain-containing protein n=1 Tax=Sandaracinus amylolyticus TaxID=927083 RepID=UPI001EFF1122|nr:reverse transcriptase domain-containing protein [Sandaracinus amylolyticus]UJR86233.1 Hypothetical protein I5071_83150 [Sandaracinus amylolyticus]